jgi:hypothetical protein
MYNNSLIVSSVVIETLNLLFQDLLRELQILLIKVEPIN